MEEEEGKLTQVEESGLGRDRWLRGGFSLIPSGINTNTHIQWRYAVFYCHQHKDSHISFCALIFTIRSKSMVIKSRLLTQLEDTWVYINWYFSPNIGDNFINRSFSIPHPIKDILLWDRRIVICRMKKKCNDLSSSELEPFPGKPCKNRKSSVFVKTWLQKCFWENVKTFSVVCSLKSL